MKRNQKNQIYFTITYSGMQPLLKDNILVTVKPLSKYPGEIENQGRGISGNTPLF